MSDITSWRDGTMTCMGCQWCQAQVMLEGFQTVKKKKKNNHNPDKKRLLRNENQLSVIALPTYEA